MSVCLVSRILWPGGQQRIAAAEAAYLRSRDIDVDLVFIRGTERAEPFVSIPYRRLNGPDSTSRLFAPFLRKLTSRYAPERGPDATVDVDLILGFEAHRPKYDVVIYGDPWAAVFADLGRSLRGDKYIVNVHESSFGIHDFHGNNWVPKILERKALRRSSAILAISRSNRTALEAAGFRNVHVLYPGVTAGRVSAAFASRADTVISVTNWDRGRRPEVFLDIARNLRRGRIMLVGQWAEASHLQDFRALVSGLGLEQRLMVTGPLTENALHQLYSESKVAIRFGYREAGPGMGTLEAISHGLPLVINSQIGAGELVQDGKTCRVVDESSAVHVAQVIEELLTSEAEWTEMSTNVRSLATGLTWERHGEQLERIIRSLCS